MPDDFKTRVLDPLRAHTGHRIKLPRRDGIQWDYAEGDEHREIRLSIDAGELAGDLRAEGPSAPMFALCLAAALDDIEGLPTRAVVDVTGAPPAPPGLGYKTSKQLLQFRRAAFLLHALAAVVPDRFVLTAPKEAKWAWPKWTWWGIEGYRKNKDRPDNGRARLAYEIELKPALYAAFGEGMEPIRRFQSHFPVVVHSGEVTKESHWTVGGKAGVDLWVASADDRRVHLFELEAGRQSPMGSLALAVCNAFMLHHAFGGNGHYNTDGVGIAAVRKARRMVMWMVADNYHPLIFDQEEGDSTVLRWLNRAVRRSNLQFGVLPWQGDVTSPEFLFDQRWGGGFR